MIKKLKNLQNFLLQTKVVFAVFGLLLLGNFLLVKKFGENYGEKIPLILTLLIIVWVYVITGISFWLARKTQKFKLYKSIPVFLLFFVILLFIYSKLKELLPSAKILLNFLDVIGVSLLFTPLLLIVMSAIRLKSLRRKKVLTYAGLVIILVGLVIFFNDLRQATVNFYYRTINPEAGAIRLERLYKENFDNAQSLLDEANFTISEMQQNAKDANSFFSYQEKIRGYFSKREAHFVEMLRIDEEAQKLRLSNNYKEFYQKRREADQNEYEAFKIYRDGMQSIMDGILSYQKFVDMHKKAMIALAPLMMIKGYTQENIDAFDRVVSSLKFQYLEIKSLTEKGVLTENLREAIEFDIETLDLFNQMTKKNLEHDAEAVNKLQSQLMQRVKKKRPDNIKLLLEWAEEKRQPVFEAQNEKHRKSLDLYNQAYTYAKNKNLQNILSVWGNSPPGTFTERKKS